MNDILYILFWDYLPLLFLVWFVINFILRPIRSVIEEIKNPTV